MSAIGRNNKLASKDPGRETDAPAKPSSQDHRSASISDVAKAADVSIATVSRVLNTPGLVSADTTQRVRDAIAALGFRPNLFARGLMTRQSRVIGLSVPDLHGEFYSAILRAADARARAAGYHLLVSTETRGHQAEDQYMPLGLLDGLAMMITEPSEKLVTHARASGVPIVLLDADPKDLHVDAVEVDNTTGTAEATNHLLEFAPPNYCVFVGGPAENFDTIERSAAFRAVLNKRGNNTNPTPCYFGEYSVNWGRAWASQMIRDGHLRGRGVLAGNDEIAWGIMTAAHEAGLHVPSDLRVIGFDDTRLCTLVRPALSSVRVPLAELGSAAIDLLLARIGNPELEPERRRLRTSLVIRQSSRPQA